MEQEIETINQTFFVHPVTSRLFLLQYSHAKDSYPKYIVHRNPQREEFRSYIEAHLLGLF